MTDTFEQMVREMRAAQKKYFKTRDRSVLEDARSLEAEVDRYLNQRQLGMDLFDK